MSSLSDDRCVRCDGRFIEPIILPVSTPRPAPVSAMTASVTASTPTAAMTIPEDKGWIFRLKGQG